MALFRQALAAPLTEHTSVCQGHATLAFTLQRDAVRRMCAHVTMALHTLASQPSARSTRGTSARLVMVATTCAQTTSATSILYARCTSMSPPPPLAPVTAGATPSSVFARMEWALQARVVQSMATPCVSHALVLSISRTATQCASPTGAAAPMVRRKLGLDAPHTMERCACQDLVMWATTMMATCVSRMCASVITALHIQASRASAQAMAATSAPPAQKVSTCHLLASVIAVQLAPTAIRAQVEASGSRPTATGHCRASPVLQILHSS